MLASALLQLEVLNLLRHWELGINTTGVLIEQEDIIFLAGEAVGAVNELIVEDEDIVTGEVAGLPDEMALGGYAIKLRAAAIDLG